MHNFDGVALLQHTSLFLPTHLIVVNLDARLHYALEEMAAFLPSFGVTLLHFHDGDSATERITPINEAQTMRMMPDLATFDLDDSYPPARATYRLHRPGVLHALRTTIKAWSDEMHHDRTVMLFVGTPRTPIEAAFLGELPLDAAALFVRRAGAPPLTLRFMVAPRRPPEHDFDLPVAHVLSDLEQTYFALPDFPRPFERRQYPDRPSGNPYDTTVWVDGVDGTEVVHLLRTIIRLHGEENARLADHVAPARRTPLTPLPLETALRMEADQRSIDWLSLCSPEHTPRLWMEGLPELNAVLDMGHDRQRRVDPFASIGRYTREKDWDDNDLVQSYLAQLERPRPVYEDLSRSDFPYRLTDHDGPSKLETARYLSDLGEFERAAEITGELIEDEPNHRLLNRILGANLFVAGHHERGREVLRHCISLTESDATLAEAERADEIATLHHLMSDYDAAISGYERAVEADPLNAHAYQGLVLIYRARAEDSLADHWLTAAKRRDLDLPLLTSEDRIDEAFEPARPATTPTEDSHTRERRSRWWSFLKR